MEHGEFEKGNKTAPRNVEVAIAVCGAGGKIIPVSVLVHVYSNIIVYGLYFTGI